MNYSTNLSIESLTATINGVAYIERWDGIFSYEKLYQISNFGRVKSFSWGKQKIMTQHLSNKGYLVVHLSDPRLKRGVIIKRVHKLVGLSFINNVNNKPQINHKDGNKLNNHVSNLEWSTQLENSIHALAMGLRPSGEKSHMAKLTKQQVLKIIEELKSGKYQKDIANDYHIHQSHVSRIKRGVAWKYS